MTGAGTGMVTFISPAPNTMHAMAMPKMPSADFPFELLFSEPIGIGRHFSPPSDAVRIGL